MIRIRDDIPSAKKSGMLQLFVIVRNLKFPRNRINTSVDMFLFINVLSDWLVVAVLFW